MTTRTIAGDDQADELADAEDARDARGDLRGEVDRDARDRLTAERVLDGLLGRRGDLELRLLEHDGRHCGAAVLRHEPDPGRHLEQGRALRRACCAEPRSGPCPRRAGPAWSPRLRPRPGRASRPPRPAFARRRAAPGPARAGWSPGRAASGRRRSAAPGRLGRPASRTGQRPATTPSMPEAAATRSLIDGLLGSRQGAAAFRPEDDRAAATGRGRELRGEALGDLRRRGARDDRPFARWPPQRVNATPATARIKSQATTTVRLRGSRNCQCDRGIQPCQVSGSMWMLPLAGASKHAHRAPRLGRG